MPWIRICIPNTYLDPDPGQNECQSMRKRYKSPGFATLVTIGSSALALLFDLNFSSNLKEQNIDSGKAELALPLRQRIGITVSGSNPDSPYCF
jgi:hypothetical protein